MCSCSHLRRSGPSPGAALTRGPADERPRIAAVTPLPHSGRVDDLAA
jgi:hypothetical protein